MSQSFGKGGNCMRHGYVPAWPCAHCEAYESKLKAEARRGALKEVLMLMVANPTYLAFEVALRKLAADGGAE